MAAQPTDPFAWLQVRRGPALVCQPLARLARHLFTTRSWTLGTALDNRSEGWREVAESIGVKNERLVRAHQVHGSNAFVARAGVRPEADIIVSIEPNLAIAIQSADCVPLLMADEATGAVAAAHAGWRGLAARVPTHAVEALVREFGSRPSDLVAAIGPSIGACCYEVGEDVRVRFSTAGFDATEMARWFLRRPQPPASDHVLPTLGCPPRPGHYYFDSWTAARDQLMAAGIPSDRIHTAELCTAGHPDMLCSYRRFRNEAGRMAAVITAARRDEG